MDPLEELKLTGSSEHEVNKTIFHRWKIDLQAKVGDLCSK